jgi:prepilin signal peptidase PulO-like enzyme (type II secretory pathway)
VTFLIILFTFLFGSAIGSFLNVVIYRYNTGVGINGRSGCMTCGRTLSWYELVPVLSFLIQRGRCRGCGTKLSWQYPAVELLTGVLFVAVVQKYIGAALDIKLYVELAMMLVVWSLLVVILVYDVRHKIIPNGFVYTFAFLGLVRIFMTVPFEPRTIFIWTLLAGPILYLPFYLLWKISDGRWIGLGDGKLALGIGWMLGMGHGLSAIFLAFWIGALVSIIMMVIMRLKSGGNKLTMKSEIPFAPYLILGFTIVYFWPIDVVGLNAMFGI